MAIAASGRPKLRFSEVEQQGVQETRFVRTTFLALRSAATSAGLSSSRKSRRSHTSAVSILSSDS